MDIPFDITSAFHRVEESLKPVEYRDVLSAPYADESRVTDAQRTIWRLMDHWEGRVDEEGLLVPQLIGNIGAKGAGKSHMGAAFALRKAQKYPGSMGCVVANSYGQVKDNAIPAFEKACGMIDMEAEFFNSKKIRGRPYTQLYVVQLGGGKESYILVRSMDAVEKIEGVELDWLWVEEIQHAPKDAFVTYFSRVRGQKGDRSVYIAGMSDSEFHYMYSLLPAAGFVEAKNHDIMRHPGLLIEPNLRENIRNVGQQYIDRLLSIYDEDQAKMYVEGRRVSLGSNKVVPAYDDSLHRTGIRSLLTAKYDAALPLYVSIDFNLTPMTATLWQMKPWNDAWDAPEMFIRDGRLMRLEGKEIVPVDLATLPRANAEILAQVDEFEVYPDGALSGTEHLMKELWETNPAEKYKYETTPGTYADHAAGVTILGDATGNRGDTRSHTSDWHIIEESVSRYAVKNATVIRGLEQSFNAKEGVTKYSNPPRRDTINRLNGYLRNAKGEVSMCFLPSSLLKSGGAARSVAMLTYRHDGTVDDSVDKKDARDQYRTHPFDTVRYIVWYITGGSSLSVAAFEREVAEMEGDEWDTTRSTGFFGY
jgi:hypothetical protein